ncbi:MAG: 5-(carboxyamino)imidazole ribonucleotide synthase [Phycisphaeraceae bacterium]|nr:5-(carboxyamino)imidazole ribonucleotide synthase [Phycisphaeraceae bacterium]
MIPSNTSRREGKTVGILGGGQLGRMLALAGAPWGLRFVFLDPSPEACSKDLGPLVTAGYDDRRALAELADRADLITYEFENVPSDAARWLAKRTPVHPSPEALDASQDRLTEKRFFELLGARVPRYAHVDARLDLTAAIEHIGLPSILKTRRMGYDGRGQWMLRTAADGVDAIAHLGGAGTVLEEFVRFDRELSIVAARGATGEIACYPLVENVHDEGILRQTVAPAPGIPAQVQAEAERIARGALETLNYVGVIAIEFFLVGDQLFVNEMAPRVHNTGHWTIEGARTSQFAQHLRAILGLPLGDPTPLGRSVMFNCVGGMPSLEDVITIEGAHLHDYAKGRRPGRKVGHLTVVSLGGPDDPTFDDRVAKARALVDGAWRR